MSPGYPQLFLALTLCLSGLAYGNQDKPFVHLFEWKWTDIQKECRFLAEKGYGAVQISPPNEHAEFASQPWYQRYQPVSYKLHSRSGTEEQLEEMIETCWKQHGIKIYADVVINHMASPAHPEAGTGSAGTQYNDTLEFQLHLSSNAPQSFQKSDFNAQCAIDWETHPVATSDIQNCWVANGGLPDLKTGSSKIRTAQAAYLNKLIDIGISGFRIDAAKHMSVEDIRGLVQRVKNLRSDKGWFPSHSRPFIFQEVIRGDGQPVTPEMYTIPVNNTPLMVTEFNYGARLTELLRPDGSRQLSELLTGGFPAAEQWELLGDSSALVFIDNHDNQRGHGAGEWGGINDQDIKGVITHFYSHDLYTLANQLMLAWPYGTARVMSSYQWQRTIVEQKTYERPRDQFKDLNDGAGPPSDSEGNTNDVECGKGWVCEHRWPGIANMVSFYNATAEARQIGHTWHNNKDQIAFARVDSKGKSQGFAAFNNQADTLKALLPTGLPPGRYCNVASADYVSGTTDCGSSAVEVDIEGMATIEVPPFRALAIHRQAATLKPVGDCLR